MKKRNLRSLKNFKTEVEETHVLMNALEAQILATQQLLVFTKAKSRPEYEKFKKFLELNNRQTQKMHELGFIALFANFECFMFEIVKELFKKHPSSFQTEKIVKFEDLKDFKSVKEVKNYFIDSLAIEKSYDIETWIDFLHRRFGLIIFKTNKDLRRFKALNSLRNIILHSGSKTNSKFSKEMRDFLKTPVPIGKPFNLDMKKFFIILHNVLLELIQNIENQ
jgi:hypothetical protein